MLHYEQFENFLREYRKGCLTKTGRKKRELSPTRQGITWCQKWINHSKREKSQFYLAFQNHHSLRDELS